MDLISREALREAMYHEAFEMDSDMQKWDSGCWIRYKMFENHLKDAPSVPAVPLDKLCELLSHCTFPCDLLYLRCPYGECNKTTNYRKESEECWKAVLTKRMEGKDNG